MKATIAWAMTLLLAVPAFGHSRGQSLKSAQNTESSMPSVVSAESEPVSSPVSSSRPTPNAASPDSNSPPPRPDLGEQFIPGPDYIIGLGDVLRISVWREPEFSSTVQVRSDGKISFPLLNEILVVGYKPMELAAYLTDRLTKFVDDPRVTVIVSQARPPIIYMVGEVGHRGPMSLTPNMTVLEALVTAGLDTFANTKKIYVLRLQNGVQQKLPVNYKRMVKGKTTNQNIVLKAGDMVVVP